MLGTEMDSYQEILEALEKPRKCRRRKRIKKKTPDLPEVIDANMVIEQVEKTKEEILAERKAKKAAKKQGKNHLSGEPPLKSEISVATTEVVEPAVSAEPQEKSREEILKEREMKKLAKQSAKQKKPTTTVEPVAEEKVSTLSTASTAELTQTVSTASTICDKGPDFEQHVLELLAAENSSPESIEKKPATTKAERRAIQEAQRAAKEAAAKEAAAAKMPKKVNTERPMKSSKPVTKAKPEKQVKPVPDPAQRRVKLFNHLYTEKRDPNIPVNSRIIHPAIIRLGVQYANKIVTGGNARCVALLRAIRELVRDYETPEQKDFERGLESLLTPSMEYLKECRTPSESMINAIKFIKWQINILKPEDSDAMKRDILLECIDTYIRDQIEKAAQAINNFVQEKITTGDVVLTYGNSSLVKHILLMAKDRLDQFHVVIVDSLPRREGQEMLRTLLKAGIQCTCILISAISFIMPVVTKVLLGAHALLANGHVMSRVGTAQIALVSKAFNVPVLVCCETHKFSERVVTDALVHNEIDDPNALVQQTAAGVKDPLGRWENTPYLTPLNLMYDFTPPEHVTAVITEIGILPCTSAPVILRIKPSEIGY